MRIRILTTILCIAFILCLSVPSQAAKRTALVIGNANYAAAPLKNPVNDAVDMAKALKELGFEVITKVNSGREEIILF